MGIMIEKIAVFGRAAQRAVSREFTKRLVPVATLREIMGSAHPSFGALSKAFKKDLIATQQKARERILDWAQKSPLAKPVTAEALKGFTTAQLKVMKTMTGKTMAPIGGMPEFLKSLREGISGGERSAMTRKVQALSKGDVRVLRSVIGAHELAEVRMGARKKLRGPMFRSHVTPAVLLDESSRLSALGPKRAKVKDLMRYMRRVTGEEDELREIIPGYIHGVSRFNRSQRRRLSDIINKKKEEKAAGMKALLQRLDEMQKRK